jgi:hypothetical protein
MEATGRVYPGDAERGPSMATRSTPKKSRGETPAPKKARPKKAQPQGAESNGPATPPEARPGSEAKRLPAATIRALKELRAGKLTRYEDEDDLFRKLGIKLGKA